MAPPYHAPESHGMADDETLLRQAIMLSAEVHAAGQHPYAALLADSGGRVLMEQGNGFAPYGDGIAHAERRSPPVPAWNCRQ
ncbi:cytidine/deoxycytidylate deaminase family protein [Falsiroseomonas tokyonensis]|uniref:Cytidine deaminase n=1 Tax=Falsiroseomonas tokyonensis TaxID=430521 RepID=A0ABV7BR54_9PROT|nr:hypothetical protein [Falsiroseomonas tokyonensis]